MFDGGYLVLHDGDDLFDLLSLDDQGSVTGAARIHGGLHLLRPDQHRDGWLWLADARVRDGLV